MQNEYLKLLSRFKTISSYGISQLISPLNQVIISLIIIRLHSAELWGSYVQLLVLGNLILIFTSFGSRDFLIKSFSSNPGKIYQTWFSNSLGRTIFLTPALFVIFFLPFEKEIQIAFIFWLITNFIINSFQVLILYNRDFKAAIIIDSIISITLFLAIFLYHESLSLYLILILVTAYNMLRAICYLVFYSKNFSNLYFKISVASLLSSFPFFIPMLAGTLRSKIDLYFAAFLLEKSELGQYQILLGILGFAPLLGTFLINPYIKNLFRINDNIRRKLETKSVILGLAMALIFIFPLYYVITFIYGINFPGIYYFMAFIIIQPVFLHVLLVNDFYKNDRQQVVASIAFFVLLIQAVAGYFLIAQLEIMGALIIKSVGIWLILIALMFYRKTAFKNEKFV